jgi:inorganic pyrophosphatase
MILRKLTSVRLQDERLHVMHLDGVLVIFLRDEHKARRVVLGSDYPLENSLEQEYWLGLKEFIDGKQNKIKVLAIDSLTFQLQPIKSHEAWQSFERIVLRR